MFLGLMVVTLIPKYLTNINNKILSIFQYKHLFDKRSLTKFWTLMITSYPKVAEKADHALIPLY